ncbi:MAG: hypothetical protein K2H29_02180 [Oscillospiraceae bacterium]|nr:hypothetical protein [Oscillospiraceae bacterium]
MKNANIEKVNKLGKVSRIILNIMRVICIVGVVCCLIGTAFAGFGIKSDTVFQVTGNASAQIVVDENVNLIFQSDKIKVHGMELSLEEDLENLTAQDFNLPGADLDMNVEKSEQDGLTVYDITADLNADGVDSFKSMACRKCLEGALLSAVMLIAVIFGGKFAKALELCETPFEENVLKTMKNFGFSLIPMGLVYLSDGGIDLTAIVLIIAIIIFTYIFKYGAELQKESDETV